MYGYMMMFFLGAFIVVIGCFNMAGHVESLHWYHRRRVSPEDIKAFGKLVGIGTVTIGGGIVLGSLLFMIAESSSLPFLYVLGACFVIACTAVGLFLSFYAMIKYNKGIF